MQQKQRYKHRLKNQGIVPQSFWSHEHAGHTDAARKEIRELLNSSSLADDFITPKPEKLIYQALQIATNPGDLVLDSFASSGTTGAVAHKMGRRWIMVELGDHCHTHIIPHLQKVIDNQDPGGITKTTNWQGGGGFRYYRLAPSDIHYWQHGYSTEQDYIYVTTQNLNHDQLVQLSDDVGTDRTLLVLCSAFRSKADNFPNLTVKKIPAHVLHRCEWDHDDYSLKIENLPQASPKEGQIELSLE